MHRRWRGGQELESLVASSIHTLLATEEYIQQFQVDNYRRTNYESIKETPKRLGKDLEEIDIVYDYDFPLLYEVEQKLQGIDRKRALSGIFYKICKGEYGIRQHEQMLSFLHEASIHNPLIQPMYEDQTSVFDPLVILELGEMRCGQVARLACDFFDAVGYKTRLVQLGGHIIAEIWYDNGWHYFDADLFSIGETVQLDGKIPSVEELSHFPELLDSLNSSYFESAICSTGGQNLYPSGPYFNVNSYQGGDPLYYIKNASDKECLERDYGWSHYETIKDEDRILYDAEIAYEPSIPIIEEIHYDKDKNKLLLKWKGSKDNNNDLLGYQIMIGSKSRNYDYYKFFGEERTKKYWNGPYKEEMYEYVGKLPFSDLGIFETGDTEIEIEMQREWREVYITIMPFDLHGKEAGRAVFKVSNELKITI